MGEEHGSTPEPPDRFSVLASVLLGLALIALPVAVVAFGHFSDGRSGAAMHVPPTAGAPTSPGTSPSAANPSHPQSSLPDVTGQTCVAGGATPLRVVSFNIESAHGPDGSVQVDLLARTLKSWKPDLVLLQEVDRDQLRTGRVDMPAYLGTELGLYSTFGANLAGRDGGQYGTALLSRFPILSAENTPLPRLPGDEPRGLLHAVVDVDGTHLSVYVVHLEHTSARARMPQIRKIRQVAAHDPLPKLLGGDFNAHPDSAVMTVARAIAFDTWSAVGSGPGLTVPRVAPRSRIDYLLETGLVPVDMQVLTPPLSDHRALWARYALNPPGSVCLPTFGRPTASVTP